MVFSSIPIYLDPPNWQQQQQPNQQDGVTNETPHLPPLPPPPPDSGSIRPGSMADRARLAKIPQPETSLKCPRCESTNTKFCYFNNYSLSQPRHFCKTCRRYWTRGGALRNVPVGGGCRRNKKTKNQRINSKSPVSNNNNNENPQMGSNSTSTSPLPSDIINHHHQLPFLPSLHNLNQFGVGNINGFNYGGIHTNGANGSQAEMGLYHPIGNNNNNNGILSNGGMQQQFSFFEPPQATGLYPFLQSDQVVEASSSSMVGDDSQLIPSMTSSSRVSQSAPLKMDDSNNQQGLNLSVISWYLRDQ